MKFSKYIIKAVTIVMALFQKQHRLFFKQSYDTLRLSRCESAASAGTAQSERCLHRNQRAVSTSHNVPSDIMGIDPNAYEAVETDLFTTNESKRFIIDRIAKLQLL